MPIEFHCPHCGSCTQVDDQYAGHSGHCATCNKPITIQRGEPLPPIRKRGMQPPFSAQSSGGSLTVMLVLETTGTDVMWTEPRDLESDRISFVINNGLPGELGSRHVRGSHLLMADGMVHHVSELTTPAELRAMATIAGGEAVAPRGTAR